MKNCLKWRFVVPDDEWWTIPANVERVCIVDDTIRDIFFNKGFHIDDHCLEDMRKLLSKICSLNFRKACERYLYSSEYVSGDNELVIDAREACQERAEIQ
ncbi:hypothetical protein MP638_000354 [Amoeboaphelidium occidentale]|nr:hypothetical protein MP638_000354 [Amoeboaphelidium occidentale]